MTATHLGKKVDQAAGDLASHGYEVVGAVGVGVELQEKALAPKLVGRGNMFLNL